MPTPVPDTRTALLEAAELLFGQRGYAAVGTREIAEEADANLASINYHFGSKRELYLATVRRVMARNEDEALLTALDEVPADRFGAAVHLGTFVRQTIANLLDEGERRSCATLVLWEAVQPSEAIDAVVDDYIRPWHEQLRAVVRRLLPASDRRGADLVVRSILGQLLHYHVFRPFIERLDAPIDGDEVATHITSFSLRAMAYDDDFIGRVITQIGEGEQPLLARETRR